jgi:hypothetical protein
MGGIMPKVFAPGQTEVDFFATRALVKSPHAVCKN